MAGLYTTRIVAGAIDPDHPRDFVVPDGYVAVLRELDLVEGGSGGACAVEVDGMLSIWVDGIGDGDFHGHQWTGRLAVDAGSTVQVQCSVGTWYTTLTGYLLTA